MNEPMKRGAVSRRFAGSLERRLTNRKWGFALEKKQAPSLKADLPLTIQWGAFR